MYIYAIDEFEQIEDKRGVVNGKNKNTTNFMWW